MQTRFQLARALGLLGALAVPSVSGAYQLDYQLTAGIENNDNVNFSENDPVSANILEPKLGFNLQQQGSTIQASATGVVEYYDYLGGELADHFRSELSGRLNWTAIPERLNFTVEDVLSVQPIDSLEPNTPSNQQQTNVFGLGPTFDFRLGPTLRGQADLRYVSSYAENTKEFNTNRGAGALRAIKDLDFASALSANVGYQYVDFTDPSSTEPNYSNYNVFGRYTRKWAKVDMTADAGWEWLSYNGNQLADQSNPLGRVNLTWHTTDRSTFTGAATYQYSDSAADMITDMVIGGSVPGSIATGTAVGTSQPYLERALSVGYAYAGDRAKFGITPFYRKLDYATPPASTNLLGADQTGHGGAGTFSYLLRPLLTASLGGTYENVTYDTVDQKDKTWTVTAMLAQQWTSHVSGQFSYTRYDRSSNAAGVSSNQNIFYFAVTYTR
jgi:hypothetical protein